MKRYILQIALCLLVIGELSAQQVAQYSQYNLNYYLMNPAVGGVGSNLEAQLGFRSQWTGFEGAPTSMYMSIHTPIKYPSSNSHLKKHPYQGVGGYVFKDQAGANSFTGAYFSYAYHIRVTNKNTFSFGASMGVKQYALDGSKIEFTQVTDDPKVTGANETNTLPDGNAGFWYHTDHFFGGIAINQLLSNSIDITQAAPQNSFGQLDNHYFMNVGYVYDVDKHLKLVPSILVKAVQPAPLQVDVSLKAIFDKTYWVGGSVRNFDALVVFAGFNYNKFEFGYSFDLTLNEIQKHSAGSHEIIIGLLLPQAQYPVQCPSQFW